MASTILYYYEQGYRHFLFFVNQNNIVDKTENNFIDNTHTNTFSKEKIVIDDKNHYHQKKKVDTFSNNPQGIEIKFTSIQKLYNDIHLQRKIRPLWTICIARISLCLLMKLIMNTDTNKILLAKQELIPTEIQEQPIEAEIEKEAGRHTVIELILNKMGKKNKIKMCFWNLQQQSQYRKYC